MQVREMISAHPDVQGSTADALLKFIEDAYDCAQTCTSCADACLAEDMVADLRQCIRLNLDCADICAAAGAMASRRTGSNEAVLAATIRACAEACQRCADDCQQHAEMHEHCRICAESCRRCAEACEQAISQVQ
ncbi:four-helix bundle copper-binding protein [Pseudosulfitobacter koreensis]|uniref:Four-helix bundle copper-binding protein n=1 Tax=Pseudosulfitobacter koreensis TaxID=2968472 RepID=A0ABT1YWM1_9RHOB|nr:four-helix bundle copper-binding protein [Pseudosulfitobacter koreense]MCR8825285.1 four-helix bundle copper-binding protein [Pseudosulfitobacter koreense]